MYAMPCPNCGEVPEAKETIPPVPPMWVIACLCHPDSEATMADTEEEVIERWNDLIEAVITGKSDR